MRGHRKWCLQKSLHLPDVGGFAVQELLGQDPDLMILHFQLMEAPQSLDHAFRIALDQNIRHTGVGISAI